ncbi:DUF1427 family protein [Streptomyces puniciscabiei]
MTSTPPTGWRRRATSIATSLVAGGVMGSVYWLIRVGTPAPPWVALTGLLGMITGEAAIKATRRRLRGETSSAMDWQGSDEAP